MDALQVQFNYWMDHHADSPPVRNAWTAFEQSTIRIATDYCPSLLPKLQNYLQQLEYQAFCGGYAAAARLAAECVAENMKTAL